MNSRLQQIELAGEPALSYCLRSPGRVYPRLFLEKKGNRAPKRTAPLSGPDASSTAIPASYTFGLECFPTFLICFCSPLFLKTSAPKTERGANFCFYASTCTMKCFGNNSIVFHFYCNVGPNCVPPPPIRNISTHLQA